MQLDWQVPLKRKVLTSLVSLEWTINNFDVAVDDDIRTTFLGAEQSKFLRIGNRKLANYTECRTNRVPIRDDISGRFLA